LLTAPRGYEEEELGGGLKTMSGSIQHEDIPGERLEQRDEAEHHISYHLCNISVRYLFASQ